jgi:signal transduction histidine kinase
MTITTDNKQILYHAAKSTDELRRLFHDLRQPLNAISVIAQELRLDANKDRLDTESLPRRMKEIESAVGELINQLDQLRDVVKSNTADDG